MPLDRKRKITLAVGATGLVAVGATAGYLLLREDRKGELICPAAPIFDAEQFEKGDYVVLQLGSIDRTFSEATWARVVGRAWFGAGADLKVELDSQLGSGGDPAPLQTDKHGFSMGQRLVVEPRCVWDRYRPLSGRATLVCGASLFALPATLGLPTAPDPRAKALQPGDSAALVVAALGKPVELVWVKIVESSVGGQVLAGEILYDTEHAALHGLLRGRRVEFVRDCVVETNLGGT